MFNPTSTPIVHKPVLHTQRSSNTIIFVSHSPPLHRAQHIAHAIMSSNPPSNKPLTHSSFSPPTPSSLPANKQHNMSSPGTSNPPDHADSTATPQAAGTTGIPSTNPISLWKRLQQVCGAGPRVDSFGADSFGADSFDEDARVLDVNEDGGDADEDEAALEGGSV